MIANMPDELAPAISDTVVELTDAMKIQAIETTVNTFLKMGISPPQTSAGLMKIFNGFGDKDQIIQWFQEGKIIWIKDLLDSTPYEEYKTSMNTAIIHYLTNT